VALGAGAPAANGACPNETSREQQHATFLADCRAYELVSPPEKNGEGVATGSIFTWAAADGSASTFRSLAPFGDAVGTGITVQYMAERSTDPEPGNSGWATHAITPAQEPMNAAWLTGPLYEPSYMTLSGDLSRGILMARGVTGDPYVSKVINLFTRTDLLSAGSGTYTLMTACALCEATSTPLPGLENLGSGYGTPWLAGATPDMSHVLFESTLKLASGSNASATVNGAVPNVYESDHGVTRLVSLVPTTGSECTDPECVAPSGGAEPGKGETDKEHIRNVHAFSADGTRAVFASVVPSGDKLCSGKATGDCEQLYMRELGTEPAKTIQLNAPERVAPEAPRPATFETANGDLSRVFFRSGEQLTETPGSGLYMYDLNAPEGHRLSLIGPTGDAVLGVSEDGHYVYFTAETQLVAGEPAMPDHEARGVYLWYDGPGAPEGGVLRYVGELRRGSEGRRLEESRVSSDGRYLLFSSVSGQGLLSHYDGTDYDQEKDCPGIGANCNELYLYDSLTNRLVCASCQPDGAPAVHEATIRSEHEEDGASIQFATHENHALSEDGRYVFFSTPEPLVPQDTNGVYDAYEYDTTTGEVRLLSDGENPAPAFFEDASTNGSNAFVVTRARLVGWDFDASYDLYDVRAGGGFPEPPQPPPSCQGDACQPAPVVVIDSTPGTLTFTGPGNASSASNEAVRHKRPVKHNRKRKHRQSKRKRRAKSSKRRANTGHRGGGT
jgi:hypothetical protein